MEFLVFSSKGFQKYFFGHGGPNFGARTAGKFKEMAKNKEIYFYAN